MGALSNTVRAAFITGLAISCRRKNRPLLVTLEDLLSGAFDTVKLGSGRQVIRLTEFNGSRAEYEVPMGGLSDTDIMTVAQQAYQEALPIKTTNTATTDAELYQAIIESPFFKTSVIITLVGSQTLSDNPAANGTLRGTDAIKLGSPGLNGL